MSIKIAVIGGTNMGQLLGRGQVQNDYTPFGTSSIFTLDVDGIPIIFVDRHHTHFPRSTHPNGHFHLPHQIPRRAYMYTLAKLGVKYVIATSAVGGINGPNCIINLVEGSICTPSDFVDLTQGYYTFAFGGLVHETAFHRSPVDMFCSTLRGLIKNRVDFSSGILSCVQGPRYETPAEVKALIGSYHANYLGMTTAVPEAILAREAAMHYLLLANVTNMPLEGPPADGEEVKAVVAQKQEQLVKLIKSLIHALADTPPEFQCECIKTPSVFEMCSHTWL